MKILHTSDWHIGRTFHGHSTIDNLRVTLDALVQVVRDREIDVVAVAGDIFDSATPAADYYTVLTSVLRELREAGAIVVMTSGNHDSATRLGFQAEFAGSAGIHIVTRHSQHDQPITLDDEHGPVHFYGIPYLEPSLIRHHYPDAALRTHAQVLGYVMDRVRADLDQRGGRSVVLSHCFAVGVEVSSFEASYAEASSVETSFAGTSPVQPSDVERDITAGGLDLVPASTFDGPDYVALGHIHSRTRLSDRVRYSGAPLHYSFGEVGKPRGAWLLELGADGLEHVEWVDLPIPRSLTVLTGTIDELLTDDALASHSDDWISAILTDQVRPLDGMRRLQQRYPWCVKLQHRPMTTAAASDITYAERIQGKSDHEIVADFLTFVRNGAAPSEFERDAIAGVIGTHAGDENRREDVA